MIRRPALAVVVALAALSFLSACGSDDDEGSTTEPAPTSTPAASTPASTQASAAGTQLTIRVWRRPTRPRRRTSSGS